MPQGCVAGANDGGEGAGGVVVDIAKLSVGRRSITPASWPPTTNSTCLATARVWAGGTAPAQPHWDRRAKHPWPGSRPCSRAATQPPGSCSPARMAATPCPPLMWCCARPRASRSSTAWGMRPLAGRCSRPITPGWQRRSATWTSILGPVAAMAVSSTCPDKGCWPSGLTTGRPGRVTRYCTPHLVIANRVQGPDGRWTALDGRDLYRHQLAADAIYRATYQRELVRTLGVEWTAADAHGNRELQGIPEVLVRSFSKRTGQIDSQLERLVADGRSGPRDWSSGRSRPPASPSSTRPRTSCTTDGARRRPSADTTRTPWSGR